MGNQLIPFAAVYAYALDHGFTIVHRAFEDYADEFANTASFQSSGLIASCPWRAVRWMQQSRMLGVTLRTHLHDPQMDLGREPHTHPARGRPFIFFEGWRFRHPAGIARHHAAIRRAFAPAAACAREVESFRATLPDARLLIGVHVRQGDFASHRGGLYHFEVTEYRARMLLLAERYASLRPHFIVCSDEPRTLSEFEGLDCTISNSPMMVDLYRLALCPLIVSSSSTFAAWAAMYGGGRLWPLIKPEHPERFIDQTLPMVRTVDTVDRYVDSLQRGVNRAVEASAIAR